MVSRGSYEGSKVEGKEGTWGREQAECREGSHMGGEEQVGVWLFLPRKRRTSTSNEKEVCREGTRATYVCSHSTAETDFFTVVSSLNKY